MMRCARCLSLIAGVAFALLAAAAVPARANATGTTPILQSQRDYTAQLTIGHTLGQSFTSDGAFDTVGAYVATYQTTDAAVTLTLRRSGPGGSVLGSKRFPSMATTLGFRFPSPTRCPGQEATILKPRTCPASSRGGAIRTTSSPAARPTPTKRRSLAIARC